MGNSPDKTETLEVTDEARKAFEKKVELIKAEMSTADSKEMDFMLDFAAEPTVDDVRKVYKFGRNLGEGHSSTVQKCYLVKDNGQRFAVKVVPKSDRSSREKSYFTSELNILRNVEHPNVVRYYESYQDSSTYYHILEYCSGGTLADFFKSKKRVGDLHVIKPLFHQAICAIHYLHTHGIAHRDVKLENFLVKEKKDSVPNIKLIDFGFSRSYRRKRMKTYLGSTHYISPEVIVDKEYGPECDNWSLGVMLYIMVFGEAPFGGETKYELVNQMRKGQYHLSEEFKSKNPDLCSLITGLLEFSPDKRLKLREALLNPWFTPLHLQTIQKGLKLLTKEMLITLLIFEQKHAFQRVLRNLFVKLFLDDKEVQATIDVFRTIDLSEDGEVSVEELAYFAKNSLKEEVDKDEVLAIFSKINTKARKTLTFLDFVSSGLSQDFFEKAQYRKIMFDRIDSQGEGFVTPQKLKVTFDRLGFTCSMESIETGFKEFDLYNSGKLTFYLFNSMFDKLDARLREEADELDNIQGKMNHYQFAMALEEDN